MKTKYFFYILILIGSVVLFNACGSVSTEIKKQEFEKAEIEDWPAYDGPKEKIQVISFGVPDNILEKYPELKEKRVGFGLTNRLVETLYETNRFDFIEEKEAVVKRVVDNWTLSESDLADPMQEIKNKGLQIPKYLVYAEVYDFAVSYSETVVGIASEKTNNTLIGIQVRFVDVATGKFVPGSGLGESKNQSVAIWMSPEISFDQTTVGQASQQALNIAARNVLNRMDKKK
ncbi:MAG: hypothetical protein K9I71_08665 [Ignavibacteriales bacterium]|nr:hypothetical protein [Ignavibacteriales bacterium]MCF8316184.1 hypothetical protein [Ignavibacteriales bacterium]MCF8436686.1 hypothetical protein [Ignavibacteriales bacterium]